MRLLYGSRRVSHLSISVSFQFQRCENDTIIMLRAGWTFKDNVSFSGSAIASSGAARNE
jgi:predicted outer membrane repeat protein